MKHLKPIAMTALAAATALALYGCGTGAAQPAEGSSSESSAAPAAAAPAETSSPAAAATPTETSAPTEAAAPTGTDSAGAAQASAAHTEATAEVNPKLIALTEEFSETVDAYVDLVAQVKAAGNYEPFAEKIDELTGKIAELSEKIAAIAPTDEKSPDMEYYKNVLMPILDTYTAAAYDLIDLIEEAADQK